MGIPYHICTNLQVHVCPCVVYSTGGCTRGLTTATRAHPVATPVPRVRRVRHSVLLGVALFGHVI